MDRIKSLIEKRKFKEAVEAFLLLSPNEQEVFFKEIAPFVAPPPIMGVLFRKLNPGKTYEDFHKAWIPPLKEGQDLAHYFPYPTYVLSGENRENPRDIITVGLMWIKPEQVDSLLEQMKGMEQKRHDKISTVAEKMGPTLIYKVKALTKLGSAS